MNRLVPTALAASLLAACGGSDSAESVVLPGVTTLDLAVTKEVDVDRPSEGDEVVFTVRIVHVGGESATGVELTDSLPAGLALVAAAPGQGTYDPAAGRWDAGDVDAGTVATLTLRARVEAGTAGTTLVNTAAGLALAETDTNPANDQASAQVEVRDRVDLALAKTVDDASPREGGTIVWSLELTHVSGTSDATGVVVSDPLPAGVTFAGSTASAGAYDPGTGSWTLPSVGLGAVETLELSCTVDPGTSGTTVVNTATLVALDQDETDPGNDADSASLVVSLDTDLALAIAVDEPNPVEGEAVTFTLELLNQGPALATGIEVTNVLDPGLTYVSHGSGLGGFDAATGVWSVAALPLGPPATLTLTADVDPGTSGSTLASSATVTALDQTDVDPSDDAANATVDVVPTADLAVQLSTPDTDVVRRQPFALAVEVVHVGGGAPADAVAVDVTLPAGFVQVGATTSAGSYDPLVGTWSLAQVAVGARELLELALEVDPAAAPGTRTVDASGGSAATADPNAGNDDASLAVEVVADAVEVLVDVRGVPHVYATSDQGAWFGAGYATAEARLSQMLWKRLVIRGRVAEFFGRGAGDELLESDRESRLYGWYRAAERTAALLEPEVRSLYEAYAEGVNAWMASPGAALHPVFAAAGVPLEPWTPADSIAVWNELARNFTQSERREAQQLHAFETLLAQLGGDVDLALAQFVDPPVFDEPAAVVQQSDVPAAVQQAMADYAATVGGGGVPVVDPSTGDLPTFSNAWAVAGDESSDGRALVVADPRVGITRPNTVFEVHVRGETFEVRGAGPPGTLGLLAGFTPHVAWGVTSIALDQSDLFRITTDPVAEPGNYFLDGAWVPFLVDDTETLAIAGEPPVTETYRETVFGPLVTSLVPDAEQREEYAVRLVPFFEPERESAEGFLAMYRAGDVDAFGTALGGFRFPSVNAVFADSGGRIGYWANGAVPARSTASPLAPLAGFVALEGDDSANDWQEIVPHQLLPWVIDPAADVLFSANHMPVGAWYPIALGARPQSSTGETERSLRLRELLAGPGPFDGAAMDAVRTDGVPTGARDLARLALHARDDLGATLSQNALDALAELEVWLDPVAAGGGGATLRANHRGVAIAAALPASFRATAAPSLVTLYGGGASGALAFVKLRTAELDASGTAALTADEIQYLDDALSVALDDARAEFGPDPSTWLADYVAQKLVLAVPAWRDTNGFAPLDPSDVQPVGPLGVVGRRVLFEQPGQSYTLRLGVGESDGAGSLLPHGQGEPGSAFAADQIGAYEAEVLLPAPTTRPAVVGLGPATSTVLSY